jgi:drug/metabolite transporter (DMT)-like permease
MDFLRLPLVAVLGYVLYGERIDALAVAGMLLIVVANLANLRGANAPAR